MKYFLTIIATFIFLLPASGGQYAFTHITTKNSSLSYDGISTIMQDSRGFIWIGTYNGLNRYDGNTMQPYFKEDLGLNSDFIYMVIEDMIGNLWIGTDNGLTIYDYSKDKFIPFTCISDKGTTIKNKVTFITSDKKGKLWMLVNNQGCFSYDINQSVLKHFPYEDIGMNGFRKMVRCPDGDFYMSRYHADLYHADSLILNVTPVRFITPPINIFKMTKSRESSPILTVFFTSPAPKTA